MYLTSPQWDLLRFMISELYSEDCSPGLFFKYLTIQLLFSITQACDIFTTVELVYICVAFLASLLPNHEPNQISCLRTSNH